MTDPLRVGFAGLGTMGELMAARLVTSGADLAVWNRTPGRASALVAAGAREAESPAQMARGREVVVICVTDGPQVAEVLFAPGGLAEGLEPGSVVVDCSTTSPLAARAAAERLAAAGVGFLDAPVSGGTEGARHGTLTILVGGSAADLERARPALEALGTTVTHLGGVGAGQWAKAVNQVILASTTPSATAR